jgi:hypothetical protein
MFFQRFKFKISSISRQKVVEEHWDLPNEEILQPKDFTSDVQ